MILAINIKQYRKDNGVAQEYMAEKLNMSQPTYWRIENNETACAKRLTQIANALQTTPETLQNYHLTQHSGGNLEAADWFKMLLAEKEEMIQQQAEQIRLLKHYADYL